MSSLLPIRSALASPAFWQADPASAFDQWLAEGPLGYGEKLNRRSFIIYKGMLGRLLAYLAKDGLTLFDLDEFVLARFLDGRKLAAEPRHRYLLLFTKLYRHLKGMRLAEEDPALPLLMSRPAPERDAPEALTPLEAEALFSFDCKAEHWKEARQRAVIALMLGAGLRVSEISALTLASLTLHSAKGTVQVPGLENRPRRHVTIRSFALPVLAAWLQHRAVLAPRSAVLLPSTATGKPLHSSTIIKDIRQRVLDAGIARRYEGPTLLRNTFGAMCLAHNPLPAVQGWLGHELERTTERLLPLAKMWARHPWGALSAGA
jgi:integrase/recombinase XerD